MLKSIPVIALGAGLCLILMEIVLTGLTMPFGNLLSSTAVSFGLLGPFVFPLSLVMTLVFGLGLVAWRTYGSATSIKPLDTFFLSLYALLTCLAAVKIGLTVGGLVKRSFRQADYQHLAISLAVLMTVLSAVFLFAAVRRLIAQLVRRGLDGRASESFRWAHFCLSFSLVTAAGILNIEMFFPLLDSVDLRALWLVWAWGSALVLLMIVSPSLPRKSWMWAVGVILTIIFSLMGAERLLGGVYPLTGLIERHTVLTKHAMRLYQRVTDNDGDGVSAHFGGQDCDDNDASVTPGRLDLPNDGIDQNCTGSDFDDRKLGLPLTSTKKALKESRPNIILLTIDALRYDRLLEDMPFLKSLGEESIFFTNAYSHGASTYWSLASLLTSKLPSRLIMGRDQTPVPSETLLPEVLQRNGWTTHLFANVTVFFVRGLSQGFRHGDKDYATSHYSVHGAKPASKHLTDGMLKRLDRVKKQRKNQPFFLWGHYYDPHDPYFDVPGFPSESADDFDRYRAICASVDHALKRFVEGLKKRQLWENTILVVTADHGEEFGEHGGRFHGKSLYEEMTRVPLLIKVPGVSGRRVSVPVGQIDIAPTLLSLLKLDSVPAHRGQDHSASIVDDTPFIGNPVMLEVLPDSNYGGHILGMRNGKMKILYAPRTHRFEIFDLENDPYEQRNVAENYPELRAEILQHVDAHLYHLALGKTGAKLPLGTPKGFPRQGRKR